MGIDSPMFATHENSFQRWSGRFDRYATHYYSLFPYLGNASYGYDDFMKYLGEKFMQTDFTKIGDKVLAHLVSYEVNPHQGYGKPGLLEAYEGWRNVPPIDAIELRLTVSQIGGRIERNDWPPHVLEEWAARMKDTSRHPSYCYCPACNEKNAGIASVKNV